MSGSFPSTLTEQDIEREVVYSTHIGVSMSGIESRTSWNNSPRYRYRVRVVGRAEANGNELSALSTFVSNQRGEWDAFSFTDPYDGVTRSCRMEGNPSFRRFQKVSGWWEFTATFLSVV